MGKFYFPFKNNNFMFDLIILIVLGILTVGAFTSVNGIIIPPKVDSLTVDYGCNSECINVNYHFRSFIKNLISFVNHVRILNSFGKSFTLNLLITS